MHRPCEVLERDLETRQEYSTRLKRCCEHINDEHDVDALCLPHCCEHINDEHDVDALCRAFPKRCKKMDDAQGVRLSY